MLTACHRILSMESLLSNSAQLGVLRLQLQRISSTNQVSIRQAFQHGDVVSCLGNLLNTCICCVHPLNGSSPWAMIVTIFVVSLCFLLVNDCHKGESVFALASM